ncbi:MAG: succinyl-diaminopimelate desuccinylase [Gammaproteobacteria bacterium TMED119]|nr:MAG: succinyl-diaminopimelate desuccinylase [Gammaproteobacteria bacterium TMED119]
MNTTIELSQQLIQKPSVTPDDHGCLDLLAERLAGSGFSCQMLAFENVSNAWIVRGKQAPLFVFAGHTDVVPTGPTEHWTYPPFAGHIENGQLHGRGSADMKTAIAAMTVACEEFIQEHPKHNGSIGFLLTSDEEGPAKNGTIKVIEHLQANNIHIDYCLVGEPSSSKTMGDVIKNGRRGSLGAHLTVQGKQGHVAYPHLAINPIHHLSEILTTLSALEWDQGNEHFPATTFQVSNVRAGTGADNVIPGSAEAWFNIRFSTEITAEQIQARVASVLENYRVEIDWRLSGQPFITPEGRLVDACKTAIKQVTGIDTQLSTGGGTSDGRFIAPTGAEVVELGVTNASIHQIDEHTNIEQLMQLKETYKQVLTSLLLDQ